MTASSECRQNDASNTAQSHTATMDKSANTSSPHLKVTEFSKYQYKTNATTRPPYPLTEPNIRSAVMQSDSQGFYRAAGILSRSTLSQSLLAARPAELRVHTDCRLHVPGPRLVQTDTSVSIAAVPERRQSPAHSRADTVHCPLSLCTCSVLRACLCL